MIKFNLLKKYDRGQTAVEYILLLVVLVTVILALLKKINARYLADDAECADPNSAALVCKAKRAIQVDGGFRYFRLHGR